MKCLVDACLFFRNLDLIVQVGSWKMFLCSNFVFCCLAMGNCLHAFRGIYRYSVEFYPFVRSPNGSTLIFMCSLASPYSAVLVWIAITAHSLHPAQYSFPTWWHRNYCINDLEELLDFFSSFPENDFKVNWNLDTFLMDSIH